MEETKRLGEGVEENDQIGNDLADEGDEAASSATQSFSSPLSEEEGDYA